MTDNSRFHDMDEHRNTYHFFIVASIALVLACAFVLVSLCSVAFGSAAPVFLGFAGLVIGLVAIIIDARMGSKTWTLSLITLVLFGLVTAINVS